MLMARLVLAGVFALAGVAKLADLAGSRRAVRDFGVPRALAPAVGTLLPLVELAVAGALVGSGSAIWGAVAALVLLGGVVFAIVGALAKGRELDCHCFGRMHSRRAGIGTLARNLVLGVAAALVVSEGPGPSVPGWLGSLSSSQIGWLAGSLVAGLVIVIQSVVIVILLRRRGQALIGLDAQGRRETHGALPGLKVGELAPEFELGCAQGPAVTLAALRTAGRPVLCQNHLLGEAAC